MASKTRKTVNVTPDSCGGYTLSVGTGPAKVTIVIPGEGESADVLARAIHFLATEEWASADYAEYDVAFDDVVDADGDVYGTASCLGTVDGHEHWIGHGPEEWSECTAEGHIVPVVAWVAILGLEFATTC